MQIDVTHQMIIRNHFEIVKVVDGDGLIVKNIFTNEEEEIRLYGIDAPELSIGRKMKTDERETHMPAQLLRELGIKSYEFLKKRAKIGKPVTVIQELKNRTDKYGRTLAYVLLPNGNSLNEILIRQGYAKPYNKTYCNELPNYQELHLKAKRRKKGLYSIVQSF